MCGLPLLSHCETVKRCFSCTNWSRKKVPPISEQCPVAQCLGLAHLPSSDLCTSVQQDERALVEIYFDFTDVDPLKRILSAFPVLRMQNTLNLTVSKCSLTDSFSSKLRVSGLENENWFILPNKMNLLRPGCLISRKFRNRNTLSRN